MDTLNRQFAKPAIGKKRLDCLMVERGMFETRTKAQAVIMAGRVLVGGKKIEKAGTLVKPESSVEVLGKTRPFVGRGGLKLDAALKHFRWDLRGKVALDIGSSTGGFVDCLLQHGAVRVFAVDVGSNQMDWRLRQDQRVTLLERTNARYLQMEQIGRKADCITMDVSFISVVRILPSLVQFSEPETQLLILVKPQFEVGKGRVGKGGIVRDEKLHEESVSHVQTAAARLGFTDFQKMLCPVRGASGNQEFFLAAIFAGPNESPGTPTIAGNTARE